jgi:hypothetical protein
MTEQHICKEHGDEIVNKCQWCAKPICEKCVDEAQGYRLCDACAAKIARDKPLAKRKERFSRGPVRNIDHSLNEEQIALARKLFIEKDKKKGPKIRNVPDEWPKLEE